MRTLVQRSTLSSGVNCPICGQHHQLEDLKGARVLREQCYFKCPGDGKEFEIVVRERVPDELQPNDPEMNTLPDIPADEPGTMGGTEFLNEPADEDEEEPDDTEEESADEEKADEEEGLMPDEEEEQKKESFSVKVLRLVRRGMTAKQAIDLLECGMEGGGGASSNSCGSPPAPQIVLQIQTPEPEHHEDDDSGEMEAAFGGMDPVSMGGEMGSSPSFGGMEPAPSVGGFEDMEDDGVAHGTARVEEI